MCKAGRIVLMAAGFAAMVVTLVMFGFVETRIPHIGYLGMWVLCAGVINYGAGEGDALVKRDGTEEDEL